MTNGKPCCATTWMLETRFITLGKARADMHLFVMDTMLTIISLSISDGEAIATAGI